MQSVVIMLARIDGSDGANLGELVSKNAGLDDLRAGTKEERKTRTHFRQFPGRSDEWSQPRGRPDPRTYWDTWADSGDGRPPARSPEAPHAQCPDVRRLFEGATATGSGALTRFPTHPGVLAARPASEPGQQTGDRPALRTTPRPAILPLTCRAAPAGTIPPRDAVLHSMPPGALA